MSEPTMEQMLDAYYSAVIADNAPNCMTCPHCIPPMRIT